MRSPQAREQAAVQPSLTGLPALTWTTWPAAQGEINSCTCSVDSLTQARRVLLRVRLLPPKVQQQGSRSANIYLKLRLGLLLSQLRSFCDKHPQNIVRSRSSSRSSSNIIRNCMKTQRVLDFWILPRLQRGEQRAGEVSS